jgi:drug/metabolite transporter (DMT)-like permease
MLLAAAALFSTGGAAIKATTLTGWQVASFRSGIAGIAVMLMIPAARRGWSGRSLLVGAAYAATMILFVQANKLTTAASSIFLQSTAPIYLVLLGPWLLGEHNRRRDFLLMGAMSVGLALCFFFCNAVPFLELADKLIFLAPDERQIVIGKLAPALLDASL